MLIVQVSLLSVCDIVAASSMRREDEAWQLPSGLRPVYISLLLLLSVLRLSVVSRGRRGGGMDGDEKIVSGFFVFGQVRENGASLARLPARTAHEGPPSRSSGEGRRRPNQTQKTTGPH